jgi:hypothetical protein
VLLDNGIWEVVRGTGKLKGLKGARTLHIKAVSPTDRKFILGGDFVPAENIKIVKHEPSSQDFLEARFARDFENTVLERTCLLFSRSFVFRELCIIRAYFNGNLSFFTSQEQAGLYHYSKYLSQTIREPGCIDLLLQKGFSCHAVAFLS